MRKKYYQSSPRMWVLTLPLVLALISWGCSLSGLTSGESESSTPTRIPLPTFTPTPVNIVSIDTAPATAEATQPEQPPVEVTEPQSVIASPTPPPAQQEPTEEPPPTSDGPVTITVQQNMNVRGGPGTNYPVIGSAPAGASARVVGRNADSSWVQVQYPPGSGSTGWVYGQLVKIEGNLENVSIVQAPAPPPPPDPDPPPDPGPTPPPAPKYQFTPAAWHASANEAIIHFRGTILDEGGNAVNGFSVLVDNGSWSVLAHPTGASHHYPETPDGEWDVVIPQVSTGVGWWTITVVSYDCPNFEGRFDAQCKQFTRLSEDIRVEIIWPDETIIWADWTCHWDCNKGLYVQAYRRP